MKKIIKDHTSNRLGKSEREIKIIRTLTLIIEIFLNKFASSKTMKAV